MTNIFPAASALIDALAALRQAEAAINGALGLIGVDGYQPPDRRQAAQRTTGTQILAVLAGARDPLTLFDIADGLIAIRRGEDEPRKGGGTRYQEMARSALIRLVERGLVRRVEPPKGDKKALVRFARA